MPGAPQRDLKKAFLNQQDLFFRALALTPDTKQLDDFSRSESGATAIEYGLIAAAIAVAIIAVVQGLGTNLNTTFGNISTALR